MKVYQGEIKVELETLFKKIEEGHKDNFDNLKLIDQFFQKNNILDKDKSLIYLIEEIKINILLNNRNSVDLLQIKIIEIFLFKILGRNLEIENMFNKFENTPQIDYLKDKNYILTLLKELENKKIFEYRKIVYDLIAIFNEIRNNTYHEIDYFDFIYSKEIKIKVEKKRIEKIKKLINKTSMEKNDKENFLKIIKYYFENDKSHRNPENLSFLNCISSLNNMIFRYFMKFFEMNKIFMEKEIFLFENFLEKNKKNIKEGKFIYHIFKGIIKNEDIEINKPITMSIEDKIIELKTQYEKFK